MKLKENKPYKNVVYNFDITYVVFAMSVAKKKSISFLRLVSFFKKIMFHVFDLFFILCRRGLVGLPTRLTNKGRAGSVQAGTDDGSLQDESSLDGEDSEKQ